MSTQTQGVSFNPDNFSEGGAIATGPQRITKSEIVAFDYGRKAPTAIGLMWTMVGDDQKESTQFYSAGDPTRWEPSIDGQSLVPRTPGQEITKSCNFGWLMTELINAGFDQNKLSNRAGDFAGLYAIFEEKKQPKREGLAQTEAQSQRVATSAMPVKVLQMPGEAATPIAPGGMVAGAPPIAAAAPPVAPPVVAAAAPTVAAPPVAAVVPPVAAPVVPPPAVPPAVPPGPVAVNGTDPSIVAGKLIGVLDATAAANGGAMTMQGVMATIWGPQGLANDPDKDAVMAMVGDPAASAPYLAQSGITQTGDNFTKA